MKKTDYRIVGLIVVLALVGLYCVYPKLKEGVGYDWHDSDDYAKKTLGDCGNYIKNCNNGSTCGIGSSYYKHGYCYKDNKYNQFKYNLGFLGDYTRKNQWVKNSDLNTIQKRWRDKCKGITNKTNRNSCWRRFKRNRIKSACKEKSCWNKRWTEQWT